MTPEPIFNETVECEKCKRTFDSNDVSIKYDRVFCENCDKLDYLTLMVGITKTHILRKAREGNK